MFKFFRRIRRKLIDEGNLKKYVGYALGEILLVMIGILLALQVNNWNTERESNKEQRKYLIALHDEFQNNLQEVNRNLTLCDSILIACLTIVNEKQEVDAAGELKLLKANQRAYRFPPKFIQSPGILSDLVNAGYLSKLHNQELRKQIQSWFAICQKVEEQELELWTHRNNVLEYMQKESSFRNVLIDLEDPILGDLDARGLKSNYVAMYNNNYFDNLNILYAIVITALKDFVYPELKHNIESVLTEIEKEIY